MKSRHEFDDQMQWPLVNFVKTVAKRTAEMSTPRAFFFTIFTYVSGHHRSRSEYAGLAITRSLSSFQWLFSNSV